MKLFKTLFIITVYIVFGGSLVWASLDIEATVEPSRVVLGEPATLTIIVSGASGSIRTPKLPDFANFRSYSQGHSQEISIVNGKMSSRNMFSFVLIPSKTGQHVLGQIAIEIGSKVYRTGVLEVEVVEEAPSRMVRPAARGGRGSQVVPPSPRSLPAEYLSGQDVFVRAWVDKDDVFVNEPVYLTYTVYTRVSATFKGFDKEAATTGFWVEEFPPRKSVNRQEKQIGGHRYVVADVRTLALFPTQTGTFSVDPGVLKIDVEVKQRDSFNDFFSRDIFGSRRRRPSFQSFFTQVVPRLFETDSVEIHVKSLPTKGKPKSFEGAVGRYHVEASLDHSRVEEGQPVTFRVRLKGEGNLNMADLPKLGEMDHFKRYDSSSSLNLEKKRFIVEGEKIAETVLIPRKAGNYDIPELEFSYFDPALKQYVTRKTRALSLRVLPSTDESPEPIAVGPVESPREVKMLGEDIRHIKDHPGRWFEEQKPLIFKKGYWNWNVFVLAAALVIFLIKLASEKLRRDVGTVRVKRSHQIARQRLKKARSLMRKNKEKEFYEALVEAAHGYLADKLNLEPGEVGYQVLEERLKDRISEDGRRRVQEALNRIDFGRFGRADTNEEDMKKLFHQCEDWMSDFEEKRL